MTIQAFRGCATVAVAGVALVAGIQGTDSSVFLHDAESPAFGYVPGRRLLPIGDSSRRLQTAPLYGGINDYAYYFADVLIGTPSQRQSVILDSGSSLLGFPCTRCGRQCGRHLDAPFDIEKSRTAERYSCLDGRCINRTGCMTGIIDTCKYSQVYSEGSSIEGFFFSDKIALGSAIDHNAFVTYDYIGCHSRETVLFTTQQASGILGVSYPKGGKQPTVMDVLMGSREVNSKVFALCAAEDGGQLSVGGYNASFHKPSLSRPATGVGLGWLRHFLRGNGRGDAGGDAGDLKVNDQVVWAKIVSDTAYAINMVSLELNGTTIATGGFGDVLVDSGTTYSYFPDEIYRSMVKALVDMCTAHNQVPLDQRPGTCVKGKTDLICYNLKDGDLSELLAMIPSFFVEFGNGGIVEWPAESWLFRKSDRVWCSAIENNRRKQTILGMSFMKQKQVIIDRDNSYIGFVAANCPAHYVEDRPDIAAQEAGSAGLAIPVDKNEAKPPAEHQPADDSAAKSAANDAVSQPAVEAPLAPMMNAVSGGDTRNWSWSFSNMPYLEGLPDNVKTSHASDNSHVSWIVGGGVGVTVIGGLIAAVVSSARPSGYGPMFSQGLVLDSTLSPGDEVHGRFPAFDELDHTDAYLQSSEPAR